MLIDADGVTVDGFRLLTVPATEDHRSFIIATWVRSGAQLFRRTSVHVGQGIHPIRRTAYIENEPGVAERHWQKSTVLIRPDNPAVCHGWLCGWEGVFLNAYIPPELRRLGLFRALSARVCGPGQVEMARPWPHGEPPPRWSYNLYLMGKL